MRIVVTSDTHRASRDFLNIIDRHKNNADLFINLGDSESEIEMLHMTNPHINIKYVAGNCDFSSTAPLEQFIKFDGKKIFFTHGHMYYVKHGYQKLQEKAKLEAVDICLFGHTHIPYIETVDGILYMNPGAVCHGSYGVIDIEPTGIMAFHNKI